MCIEAALSIDISSTLRALLRENHLTQIIIIISSDKFRLINLLYLYTMLRSVCVCIKMSFSLSPLTIPNIMNYFHRASPYSRGNGGARVRLPKGRRKKKARHCIFSHPDIDLCVMRQ